ncbi:MAG TPA: regulatory protein RecX [Patescibacteria group bacterium]|nr:regulatory protein RecX [Patescibacteria group bacterium]
MSPGNLRYAGRMSKPRPPRRISKSYLENVSLYYLERFSSSAENLRRVLLRRVERAARFHDDDPAEGVALVADLIERYQRSGLLDDKQYAGAKTRSLHRRGASTRAIRQQLSARGIEPDTIDAVLTELTDDAQGEPDLAAAHAYARRRRLGPYRVAEAEEGARDRDLAALGRAGFSWEVARAVIDGERE